jgi:predicted phage tail protein
VNNISTQTAGVIRQNGLKTTSFTALTNLAQGKYRAWVRAYNLADEVGDWSAPFDFNIDEPTPSTPTITAPVVNSLGYVENANPTFTWTTDSPAAPLFDFTLFDVTLGKTALIVRDLDTASYTVPTEKRLTEHIYVARVRAKNVSGDTSMFSAPYQFRINIPNPTTPVIVSPGDTITDTTPTFSWRHSGTSFSYEILIRDLLRNEDVSIQVKTFSLDPGGATASYSLPAANALKVGTYRFWIRSFNSLGQGSGWSTSRTFVITVQLDENLNNQRGESAEALVESQIATLSSGRSAVQVPAKVKADVVAVEDASSTEYVAMAEPVAHHHVNVIPEVPDDEALIDAFMHRLADPSADADFTFLRS